MEQVIDSENDGVPKHLGQIASSMYEWEGSVADMLGLTVAEVADIKQERKLNLQAYAIINNKNLMLLIPALYIGGKPCKSGSKSKVIMLHTKI